MHVANEVTHAFASVSGLLGKIGVADVGHPATNQNLRTRRRS